MQSLASRPSQQSGMPFQLQAEQRIVLISTGVCGPEGLAVTTGRIVSLCLDY